MRDWGGVDHFGYPADQDSKTAKVYSQPEEESSSGRTHSRLWVPGASSTSLNVILELSHKCVRPGMAANTRGLGLKSELSARLQGPPLALGPLHLSKPGMPRLLGPFFGRKKPLWEIRGIEISTRELNFEPLSWFGPFFFGSKNIKV